MINSKLAAIGLQMVLSDNQATSFPVFLVSRVAGDRFPRVFLSEAAAREYAENNNGTVVVTSANDSPDMIAVMLACLEAAGVLGHPQARNAYFTRGEQLREGL